MMAPCRKNAAKQVQLAARFVRIYVMGLWEAIPAGLDPITSGLRSFRQGRL